MKEQSVPISIIEAFLFFIVFVIPNTGLAGNSLVTIGTGGITGNYCQVGITLGDQVNKRSSENGFRAAAIRCALSDSHRLC